MEQTNAPPRGFGVNKPDPPEAQNPTKRNPLSSSRKNPKQQRKKGGEKKGETNKSTK